jgi:hypothetical protein
MVSKMYGSGIRLPENQYPPKDTVKSIITTMRKKLTKNQS